MRDLALGPICMCTRGVDATRIRFFQSFEKAVYFKRLKLSLAVHLSFRKNFDMSIVPQLLFTLPRQPQISGRFGQIKTFLKIILQFSSR